MYERFEEYPYPGYHKQGSLLIEYLVFLWHSRNCESGTIILCSLLICTRCRYRYNHWVSFSKTPFYSSLPYCFIFSLSIVDAILISSSCLIIVDWCSRPNVFPWRDGRWLRVGHRSKLQTRATSRRGSCLTHWRLDLGASRAGSWVIEDTKKLMWLYRLANSGCCVMQNLADSWILSCEFSLERH